MRRRCRAPIRAPVCAGLPVPPAADGEAGAAAPASTAAALPPNPAARRPEGPAPEALRLDNLFAGVWLPSGYDDDDAGEEEEGDGGEPGPAGLAPAGAAAPQERSNGAPGTGRGALTAVCQTVRVRAVQASLIILHCMPLRA